MTEGVQSIRPSLIWPENEDIRHTMQQQAQRLGRGGGENYKPARVAQRKEMMV